MPPCQHVGLGEPAGVEEILQRAEQDVGRSVTHPRAKPEARSGAQVAVSSPDVGLATYVGAGELRIFVPSDLTVEIRSNVNVGEIKEAEGWDLQNGQWTQDGNSGRNLSSTEVIGSGPTDLVVNAKVGLGQIIIGKE